MIGSMVDCVVKSAGGDHRVSGKIVRQCDNANIYVLELSHMVDLVDDKRYTYAAGSTMLVSSSEIVR